MSQINIDLSSRYQSQRLNHYIIIYSLSESDKEPVNI